MKSVYLSGIATIVLATGGLVTATANAGDVYPADEVRLMVPAAPGGGTDTNARIIAQYLEKYAEGSDIVVVNQTGGGGVVATQEVVEGSADGTPILHFHAAFHTANLFERSPYNWEDLTPLATLAEINEVYAVRADAPFDTLPELFEYAEANPGEITIGSQLGGTTQIRGEALPAISGTEIRVVDSGTESDRIAALLGESVDVISMSVNNALEYEEAGEIKVLAVMNNERDPFAPDWPTSAEQGVDMHFPLVFTLYGPPGMSEEAIAAMDELVTLMSEDQGLLDDLDRASQVPSFRTSEETAQYVADEFAFVADKINN